MTDGGNTRTDAGREQRIAAIKEQLQRIAGGRMICHESPSMSLEQREQFWEGILACESEGPYTSDFERLVERGIELPAPETLDDASVTVKLWEVIHALDELHVLLECTNHLSDRELYIQLWSHSLRVEVPVSDNDGDGDWHLDMVSTGSESNVRAWLMYYADEKSRQHWQNDFPDYAMPPREKPPYDRDRQLSALYYGVEPSDV